MTSEQVRNAILDIENISSTPLVLSKVYGLLKDPESHLDEIITLIQSDSGLVSDVMRIANSPFYGPHVLHSRLETALRTIGLREVFRLVALSLAQKMFLCDLASYRIGAHDYWSFSLLSALLMDATAKRLKMNGQDAYMVGILHATGRLVIDRVICQANPGRTWDGQQPVGDWEKQSIGLDSAEAGGLLLRQWLLPEFLCEAIEGQFLPSPSTGQRSLLGMLQFVRRVLPVKHLHGPIADPSSGDPFLIETGLSIEDAHGMIAQSIERLFSLESSFSAR